MTAQVLRRIASFAPVLVLATGMMATTVASAQTVALFQFDTMADQSDGVGGETLFDASGAKLDLVSANNFGTVLLTPDVPSIMPAGSYALDSNSGGASAFSTPSTTALHRGGSGELSIEFWFKSVAPPSGVGYLMSFNGGNGGTFTGNWGIYSTGAGDLRLFDYSSGFPEVGTGAAASDGNWQHVAFTMDNAGVLRSYLGGNLVNQTAATGAAAAPLADVLKFARSSGDTFAALHFKMDDLRISNVALPSGSGSGMGELAWNGALSQAPNVAPRPADFGRHWLRQHPFTITSWGFTDHPDAYTDANFNAALGGGYQAVNAAGVMPMFLGILTELNDRTRTQVEIALNAGTKAFLLRDEIPVSEIAGAGEMADHIRSRDSDALILVGLGGSTPSYVDQVITGVQPDAVIHGFYPFTGSTGATDRWYVGGLTDVALVRERALHYDLPYFAFIQSFDDQVSSNNPPEFRRRLPNESELRAELFSKMSAGVKGFAYFVFQDGTLEDIALVDPSGVKSSLYAPAAAANAEVATLGEALRFLDSTDWRFVSGGVAATPEYMEAWTPSAGNGRISGVTIQGVPQSRRDALLGFFSDDDGGEYFMLVNTFHGDSLSAADAAVDFTLTFDSSVDSIWRLNRLTGEIEQMALVGNILNLTLPGGTGDLFKINDGAFVPEPSVLLLMVLLAPMMRGRRSRLSSRERALNSH